MLRLYLSFLVLRTVQAEKVPDQIFYWENKPFIFFNSKTQQFDGILPFIYNYLIKYCSPGSSSEMLANYNLVNESFSEKMFYEMLEDKNVSDFKDGDNRIWFPLFVNLTDSQLMANNLDFDIMVKSPKVGVIVHKDKITLLNKFFQAIQLCYPIAGIAGVFIMLVSTLLWLAECYANKDFSKCFINGFGTSLWWSIVTMTAVGYGDIVAKSLIGRLISTIWMVTGVLIISGLTGIFSSIMATNSFLNIHKMEVAALNNSMDFFVAQKNYNSTLKAHNTYHEVLQAVELKKNDYGVVNIDILLHMDLKKNYPNIALIQTIDAVTCVFIVYGNKTNMFSRSKNEAFEKCKLKNTESIKKAAEELYGKIPIIENYNPQNFYESLKAGEFLYLVIITLCLFFACVMKDVVQFAYKKRYSKDISLTVFFNSNKIEDKKSKDNDFPNTLFLNRNKNEDNKSTEKEVPMTGFLCRNENEIKKLTEKDDFFEELSRMEENFIKLKTMYKK